MKKVVLFSLLLCISFVGFSQETQNEDTQTSDNSWNFNVTPYLQFAGMTGEIDFDVNPLLGGTIPVDATFSDLANNLSFAFMVNAEASKGKWTIMTDFIYLKLDKGGTTQFDSDIISSTAKAELEQIIFELGGGYQFAKTGNFTFDAIAGARFFNLDNSIAFNLTSPDGSIDISQSFNNNLSFTDPYIGFRYKTNWNKWRHTARIDVGGFGAGSEYSWKFNVMFGFDVSKTIAIAAGYQGYGVDYRESDVNFRYDMYTGGGVLGLNFHF